MHGSGVVPLVVDRDGHAVEDQGEPMAGFGRVEGLLLQMVESHGVSRELVGVAVEIFSDDGYFALVHAFLAEVAGDFSDTEEPSFSQHTPVDTGPQLVVGASLWGRLAV